MKSFFNESFLGNFFYLEAEKNGRPCLRIRRTLGQHLDCFVDVAVESSAVRSGVQLTDVTWVHSTLSPQTLRHESRRSETEYLLEVWARSSRRASWTPGAAGRAPRDTQRHRTTLKQSPTDHLRPQRKQITPAFDDTLKPEELLQVSVFYRAFPVTHTNTGRRKLVSATQWEIGKANSDLFLNLQEK